MKANDLRGLDYVETWPAEAAHAASEIDDDPRPGEGSLISVGVLCVVAALGIAILAGIAVLWGAP